MHADLSHGTLTLRITRFTLREAERLHELLSALAPFSRVVLDFSGTREISAAALVAGAAALATLRGTEILVNGLSEEAAAACSVVGAPHRDHPGPRAN